VTSPFAPDAAGRLARDDGDKANNPTPCEERRELVISPAAATLSAHWSAQDHLAHGSQRT